MIYRLFTSRASVRREYIYIVTMFGAIASFLPMLTPSSKLLERDDFPNLIYPPYILAVKLCLALCIPMLIDTLLDSMNHLSTGTEILRSALGINLFIPSLLYVLVLFEQDDPNFTLFYSLFMVQRVILFSLLFQIFNVHDREVWTDVRMTMLICGHKDSNNSKRFVIKSIQQKILDEIKTIN